MGFNLDGRRFIWRECLIPFGLGILFKPKAFEVFSHVRTSGSCFHITVDIPDDTVAIDIESPSFGVTHWAQYSESF